MENFCGQEQNGKFSFANFDSSIRTGKLSVNMVGRDVTTKNLTFLRNQMSQRKRKRKCVRTIY